MNKLKQLALLAGLAALSAPFAGTGSTEKVGFKKSMMPPKDYAKRKRRLRTSGASRNINHCLNK